MISASLPKDAIQSCDVTPLFGVFLKTNFKISQDFKTRYCWPALFEVNCERKISHGLPHVSNLCREIFLAQPAFHCSSGLPNMNSMKLTCYFMKKESKRCCDTTMPESIHTKDESKRETVFAYIFGVN